MHLVRTGVFVALCACCFTASARPQNGVTVTPSSATLQVGQTLQVTASGVPDVTWTSNDTAVATVTETGPLTATIRVVGTGDRQARIYAKYKNNTGWCDITVGSSPPPNQAPAATITSPSSNVTITAGQSVSFSGSGNDPDGTIAVYTWSFPGGSPASSGVSSPGAVTYAAAGTYTATFRVTDDDGAQSAAATRTVTVNDPPPPPQESTPYGGTPWPLPGTIQAENFDEGGEGVAYHDTTTGNTGAQYRTTDVDVQVTTDTGGGHNVGWTAVGEWLQYSVNVGIAGTYTLQVRVANNGTGAQMHVEIDGAPLQSLTLPHTGGWQIWQTLSLADVPLSTGAHKIRLVMDVSSAENASVGNFNWFSFTSEEPPPPPPPCTYSVSPATLDYPSGGGIQTVQVSTQTGCSWTVSANQAWLLNVSPTSATGTAQVSLTVQANPDSTPRAGTLTIAGQTVQVTQEAAQTSNGLCDEPVLAEQSITSPGTYYLLACEAGPPPNGWKVVIGATTYPWVDSITDLGYVAPAGPANAAGLTPYLLPVNLAAGYYPIYSIAYNYNEADGWAQTASTNSIVVAVQ